MRELQVIEKRRIFLGISAVLVGLSIAVILTLGFREGIDFTGGTLWQLEGKSLSLRALRDFFISEFRTSDAILTRDEAAGTFFIRLQDVGETKHQEYFSRLRAKFPTLKELGFQSIGPSIGRELRRNALLAVGFVLLGISLYIAFAFRKVSRPVSSWKYGAVTLATLFHDVLIPAGLLAVLGKYANVEIDGNFVVALLVVAGFSVHDTIVVFDRIREHLALDRGKTDFAIIINRSINQTLGRSVNTSLTLILVLIALLFSGPQALFYFVLTLLVGVTTGIYSSIFVASPALLLVNRRRKI